MYEGFAAFVPSGALEELKRQLRCNNIGIGEKRFAGFLLAFGASLGVAVALLAWPLLGIHSVIAFVATSFGFVFVTYFTLKLGSESRGKFVEFVLPDALQLVASNMKSGLTTEKALFVAGRPEFGPLQIELRNASKRISSGEKVEVALVGISERINSQVLEKTIWLISEGIKSGGQISDLLFRLSEDLKSEQAVQEEIKANIWIYILLILFASIFGSPLLFGVSANIVQLVSNQVSTAPKISTAAISGAGGGFVSSFATGERNLPTADFILLFSVATIVASSFFASLAIGIINSGKESAGLRYVVPVTVAALLVYFTVKSALGGVFVGLAK